MVEVINCMESLKARTIPGFRIRVVQLLSFILFVEKKFHKGRLLQINTGQGKSIIVQLVAAYYALRGSKVDIMTSKNELAKRDAVESQDFFSRLDLEVEYLSSKPPAQDDSEQASAEGESQKHVTYSTVHNLCVAELRQYMVGPCAQRRKQEFLIVDEVDSMLVDKPDITTYLSQSSYFEKHMRQFFDEFWEVFARVWHNWKVSEFSVKELREQVKLELKELMRHQIGKYPVKEFRTLATKQLDTWIDKAILAQKMQENKQYLISGSKVKIVDRDTGETQQSMRWSDGLHNFIEKKHGIAGSSFSSTFLFENHLTYIQRYKSNVVGLSGTLGSQVCRDFLADFYAVDLFKVPTFCPDRYEKVAPIVCRDKSEWKRKLLWEVEDYSRKYRRPLLMIFANIKDAEQFDELLRKKKYKAALYLKSDEKKREDFFHLKSNSIILATNYGGRGTDFKLTDKLSERGGLHVVVTFMPSNSRVERQAFGRAGRKGQRGSGRMILNAEEQPWLAEMVSGGANRRSRARSTCGARLCWRGSRSCVCDTKRSCSKATKHRSWS